MKDFSLNIRGHLYQFSTPIVAGIINVTPDSFYGASRISNNEEVAERVRRFEAEGAKIVDIGACSTRPGGVPVSEEEEMARLQGVFQAAREAAPSLLFSIDTFRSSVARIAVEEWGVDIINDVSGGNADEDMFDTVARLKVPYVLGHSRGLPGQMHEFTDYEDVTCDVLSELGDRLQQLSLLGVCDVIIDPGFGFSKTIEQNFRLLHDLSLFQLLHRPVMVGFSRKSMITETLQISKEDAKCATNVLGAMSLERGAAILRVHDVKEAVETVKLYQKVALCPPSE